MGGGYYASAAADQHLPLYYLLLPAGDTFSSAVSCHPRVLSLICALRCSHNDFRISRHLLYIRIIFVSSAQIVVLLYIMNFCLISYNTKVELHTGKKNPLI